LLNRCTSKYRWTSLYARDRDPKNRLSYNEFAYKKTKDDCKFEDRFQKKAISGLHISEIADKKTAYNEGGLYSTGFIHDWSLPNIWNYFVLT